MHTPPQDIFHVFSTFHRLRGTGGRKKPSETVLGLKLHPPNRFFSTTSTICAIFRPFSAFLNRWLPGRPGGRPGAGNYACLPKIVFLGLFSRLLSRWWKKKLQRYRGSVGLLAHTIFFGQFDLELELWSKQWPDWPNPWPAGPGSGPGMQKKVHTPPQAIFHVFSTFHRLRGTGGRKKPSETVLGLKLHSPNRFFSTTPTICAIFRPFSAFLNRWLPGRLGGRPGAGNYAYLPKNVFLGLFSRLLSRWWKKSYSAIEDR